MHVIAAKAVAFKEALQPEFKGYQEQVIENARVMAKVLHGARLAHRVRAHRLAIMFLVDLRAKKHHRQGCRSRAGPRAHHGQQERDPERSAEAVRHQRHPHRLARR